MPPLLPHLDVRDPLPHLRAEGLLGVVPLPAFAAVEFDKVPAPPLGKRMPFAHGLDRSLQRTRHTPTPQRNSGATGRRDYAMNMQRAFPPRSRMATPESACRRTRARRTRY